jgi:hypothetical protein
MLCIMQGDTHGVVWMWYVRTRLRVFRFINWVVQQRWRHLKSDPSSNCFEFVTIVHTPCYTCRYFDESHFNSKGHYRIRPPLSGPPVGCALPVIGASHSCVRTSSVSWSFEGWCPAAPGITRQYQGELQYQYGTSMLVGWCSFSVCVCVCAPSLRQDVLCVCVCVCVYLAFAKIS